MCKLHFEMKEAGIAIEKKVHIPGDTEYKNIKMKQLRGSGPPY